MDGPDLLVGLVHSCVRLAYLAGGVIRAVQADRERSEEGAEGKDALAAIGASLKDASDTRSYLTTADLRAQKVIVDGLRREFPGLVLVGEEEEDAGAAGGALADPAAWYPAPDGPPATQADSATLVVASDLPAGSFEALTLKELVVFIDPVDGTREFVQGRLLSVQTLIGISWRGRAIAGVIGLPFHDGAVGSCCAPASQAGGMVLHSVVGAGGLFGTAAAEAAAVAVAPGWQRSHPAESLVVATSKAVKEPVLQRAHAMVGGERLIAGGCGNKVLRLCIGAADVTLFNLGTSLWDTCATEAILVACGGTMTTLLGTPIEHTATVPTANRLGVVATAPSFEKAVVGGGRTHRRLCAEFVQQLNADLAALVGGGISCGSGGGCDSSQGAPPLAVQALDIARSIDGEPFSVDLLAALIGHPPGAIAGYRCDEADAVRYKQSVASRVRLLPAPAGDSAAEQSEGSLTAPTSFFYKRAVLRELPHALKKARIYPFKIRRDVRSNMVEASFLAHSTELPRAFMAASGVQIALPYRVEQAAYPEANPIDSRFALYLFDFSPDLGWRQHAHLAAPELQAALRALARWHSFFWLSRDSNAAAAVEKARLADMLWASGSYWHLGQQPQGQLAKLRPNWTRLQKEFGFPEEWDLGARLERVALRASMEAHGLDKSNIKVTAATATKTEETVAAARSSVDNNVDAAWGEGAGGEKGKASAAGREPGRAWRNASFQTIIHGDPKAANFFFRGREGEEVKGGKVESSTGTGTSGDPSVGIIDCQWCGCGLGAVDVAYCIAASADKSVFAGGRPTHAVIQGYLDDYYSALLSAFIEFGVAADASSSAALLPADVLQEQFEWAWIDLSRVIVGDHWGSLTREMVAAREGKPSFNACNKSLEVGRATMELADEYLRRRERGI